MGLFPAVERTQSGPMRPTQNPFDFFTHSDWAEVQRIRDELDKWFSEYPSGESERLKEDFRYDFNAAFFELLIHELLRRTEGEVDVHPFLDTEPTTKPDFRTTAEDESPYLVEATVATDESDVEQGLRRVQQDLTERLAEVEFPGWTFDVTFARITSDAEKVGRIEAFLREKMDGINRETVEQAFESQAFASVPSFTYKSEKVTLDFIPIPVEYDPHEGDEWNWGSVGVMKHSREAKVLLPGAGIGSKVEAKRPGRYGEFDLPYIVAVNATARHLPRKRDVISALFGSLAVQIDRRSGETKSIRQPNGVWHAKGGPNHTRISAVLAGLSLAPFTIAHHETWLVVNPWAQNEYSGALKRLPRIEVRDNKFIEHDGEPLWDVLGLPEDWPRKER